MKKSKEIITTVGELIEHYLPTVLFITLLFTGILIINSVNKINELQIEHESEETLFLLLGFAVFSFMLGMWSQENSNKLKSENGEDQSK